MSFAISSSVKALVKKSKKIRFNCFTLVLQSDNIQVYLIFNVWHISPANLPVHFMLQILRDGTLPESQAH